MKMYWAATEIPRNGLDSNLSLFFWQTSNADKVDTISVALPIWKIVPEVRSCYRYTLSVWQTPDIVPVHLLVSFFVETNKTHAATTTHKHYQNQREGMWGHKENEGITR